MHITPLGEDAPRDLLRPKLNEVIAELNRRELPPPPTQAPAALPPPAYAQGSRWKLHPTSPRALLDRHGITYLIRNLNAEQIAEVNEDLGSVPEDTEEPLA